MKAGPSYDRFGKVSSHPAAVRKVFLSSLLMTAAACGGGASSTTPLVTGTATPEGAEALELGETAHGDTSDREDTSSATCGEPDGAGDQTWTFTPESEGWYRFHVEAGYDAVLTIRDDTGGELGCNDDAATKREAELAVPLVAGRTYTVVVDGYRDSEGRYDLSVESTDEALPENRHGRLVVGQPVSDDTTNGSDTITPQCGSSAGSRDQVWHFVAPEDGTYQFQVEGQYDSVIALLDESGAQLDCNDDYNGERSRSQLTRTLTAGTVLGVVVDGWSGGEGPYQLSVTSMGGGASNPQGGTVAVGTPVNGTTTGGQNRFTPSCGAAASSPDNVWELTPTQSGTYRIHVNSQYDAVVSLWDERGAEVACNDDLNSTSESEVVVGLQAGRTYNVVVDGYNGATGDYQLLVSPDGSGAPTQSPTTQTAAFTSSGTITLGRPISDSTAGGADMVQVGCNSANAPDDIWELTVPRRGNYQIHVAAQYDSVVALLDAQHVEMVCNDDHRTTRESLVRSRLVPRNTYYVVVSGYQQEAGSYVLTVRREPKPGRRP